MITPHNMQKLLLAKFSSHSHKSRQVHLLIVNQTPMMLYGLPYGHSFVLYGYMKRSQSFKLSIAVLQNGTVQMRHFNSPK